MKIRLNGDPFELSSALTISELLEHLHIDSRRVAVEHNLVVLKRGAFETTRLAEGDEVEIVNFVGGGEGRSDRGHRATAHCSGEADAARRETSSSPSNLRYSSDV